MAIGSILACIAIGGTMIYVAVVLIADNIPPSNKPSSWEELEWKMKKERHSGNCTPPVKKLHPTKMRFRKQIKR